MAAGSSGASEEARPAARREFRFLKDVPGPKVTKTMSREVSLRMELDEFVPRDANVRFLVDVVKKEAAWFWSAAPTEVNPAVTVGESAALVRWDLKVPASDVHELDLAGKPVYPELPAYEGREVPLAAGIVRLVRDDPVATKMVVRSFRRGAEVTVKGLEPSTAYQLRAVVVDLREAPAPAAGETLATHWRLAASPFVDVVTPATDPDSVENCSSCARLRERVAELERLQAAATAEIARLAGVNSTAGQARDATAAELAATRTALAEALAQAQTAATATASAQATARAAKEGLEAARERITRFELDAQAKDAEIAQLRAAASAASAVVSTAAAAEENAAAAAALQDRVAHLQRSLEERERAQAEAQEKENEAVRRAREEREALQAEAGAKAAEVESLRAALSEARAAAEQAQHALGEAQAAAAAAAGAAADAATAREERDAAREALRAIQRSLAPLASAGATGVAEGEPEAFAAAVRAAFDEQVAERTRQAASAASAVAEAAALRAAAGQVHSSLSSVVDEAQQRARDAELRLADSAAACDGLNAEVARLREQADQLRARLADKTSALDDLRRDLESVETSAARSDVEIAELVAKCRSLEDEVARLRAVEAEFGRFRASVQEQSDAFEDNARLIRHLRNEIAALRIAAGLPLDDE